MRFWGHHGADVGEKESAQPIDADVELRCDLSRAVSSDDLADTIDYAHVHRLCEQEIAHGSCVLLEALAGRVAEAVLRDPRVLEVIVRVRKPRLLDGATPEIELQRARADR